MKKLFLLSITALFILASCGKSNKLLGKWNRVDAKSDDPTLDFTNDKARIEFLDEKKYFMTFEFANGETVSSNSTYEIKNDTLYCYAEGSTSEVFTTGKLTYISDDKFQIENFALKQVFEKIK